MGGSKVWLQKGINRNSLRTELLCKGNKKEMERERERERSKNPSGCVGRRMSHFPARANRLKS